MVQIHNGFKIKECSSLTKKKKKNQINNLPKDFGASRPYGKLLARYGYMLVPWRSEVHMQHNHYMTSNEKLRNNIPDQNANREDLIPGMYIISHRSGAFSGWYYCSVLELGTLSQGHTPWPNSKKVRLCLL
jgi:hypothetical protein